MAKRRLATNSRRWKAIRHKVLQRDNFKCRQCGRRAELEIDHIRPVKSGGDDRPSNLQTLCRECHIKKTSRENTRDPKRIEWKNFVDDATDR